MSPEFRKKIKNVLFIDIETIAAYPAYEQMPERLQQLWDKRADVIRKRAEFESWSNQDLYYEQAGISAEFGRIACIAFGGVFFNEKNRSEEHTSELQSRENLVCRLLLEKKNTNTSKD